MTVGDILPLLTITMHLIADALIQTALLLTWGTDPQPEILHISLILGFGPDGFPILNEYEYANNDGVNLVTPQSSYELIDGQNPQRYVFDAYEYIEKDNLEIYLDECNGHSHENPHGLNTTIIRLKIFLIFMDVSKGNQ